MTTLKDKQLLLLGILSTHEAHGYELNQLLKSDANPIRIGKANAYKILATFQERGWVTSTEVMQSNRPNRIVFRITPQGDAELHRLLRERLAESFPTECPDGVSLNFMGLLRPEESLDLLVKRLPRLADRCEALRAFSDDICAAHPGLFLMKKMASLELSFTRNLIRRLGSEREERR